MFKKTTKTFSLCLFSLSVWMLASCGYMPMEENRSHLDIQLVQLEDSVSLVVPSDLLFYPGTANFKKDYDDTLRAVAAYLQHYYPSSITISAYENASKKPSLNSAIAIQQSKHVATYLQKKQYAVALMMDASTTSPRKMYQGGHAKGNRRIELRFHLGE